jgi:hypothetical protein
MRRFYLILAALLLLPIRGHGEIKEAGPTGPDGTQAQVDYPKSQWQKNTGGSNGAGLCVFTSIEFAARWQHVPELEDFQAWMKSHPGGGYPSKVDAMIGQLCKQKGVQVPQYIQYQGRDLDVLRLALKTGRLPCITYDGHDGLHYRGGISHMTNVAHLDDKWAMVLDNNYPPDKSLWMSPQEFLQRWAGKGNGWAVFLLNPGPPPVPTGPKPAQTIEEGHDSEDATTHHSPLTTHHYAWEPVPSRPYQLALYCGHEHIGSWDYQESCYYSREAGTGNWTKVGRAPFDVPYFGAIWDRDAEGERFMLNGQAISRAKAIEALTGRGRPRPGPRPDPEPGPAPFPGPKPPMPDDAQKPYLTLIGPDAQVQAFLADLASNPALAAYRGKFRVQSYPETEQRYWWAWKDVKMPTGVTVQAAPGPDGKGPVLLHLDSYPGPEALAEALRRADPDFDPALKPAPVAPSSPESPAVTDHATTALLGGGTAGLIVLGLQVVGGLIAARRARMGKQPLLPGPAPVNPLAPPAPSSPASPFVIPGPAPALPGMPALAPAGVGGLVWQVVGPLVVQLGQQALQAALPLLLAEGKQILAQIVAAELAKSPLGPLVGVPAGYTPPDPPDPTPPGAVAGKVPAAA